MVKYQEKKWVDIECEYYHLLCDLTKNKQDYTPELLNQHMVILRDTLHKYLQSLNQIPDTSIIEEIKSKIIEPISKDDITSTDSKYWNIFHANKVSYYGKQRYQKLVQDYYGKDIPSECQEILKCSSFSHQTPFPPIFYLPENILIISFNYTDIIDKYISSLPTSERFKVNHIHGHLQDLDYMIFGYGNEDDQFYSKLLNKSPEYTKHLKFIRYSYDENYRHVAEFMNQGTFQVYIMGHSCGESDYSLLNRIFEHKNCVSIKPFYHKNDKGIDNFHEISTAIHRCFKKKKKGIDLIVNKKYCQPLISITKREMVSSLEYYIDAIKNMKIPQVGHHKAPYKPLLLLSIMDMMSSVDWSDFKEEQYEKFLVPFSLKLEEYFDAEWQKHKYYHRFFNEDIENVLWYMQDEPFYSLVLHIGKEPNKNRTLKVIKETYQGIKLDIELVKLLIDTTSRQVLRDVLENMLKPN